MGLTALEVAGVSAICVSAFLVLREVWDFIYTSYLGHALGKTLPLKNIGQWAGEFSFFIALFSSFAKTFFFVC